MRYRTKQHNGKQIQAKAYGFNAFKSSFEALLPDGQGMGITGLKNALNRLKTALNTVCYKYLILWRF
jgi:hypothetical protein